MMYRIEKHELRIVPLRNIDESRDIYDASFSLHSLAKQKPVVDLLHGRELHRDAEDFGGSNDAAHKRFIKYRNADFKRSIGTYALLGVKGSVLGLARVNPTPNLRQQVVSLPPLVVKRPFSKDLEIKGPQIIAWTAHQEEDDAANLLKLAYTELRDPNGIAANMYDIFAATNPNYAENPQAWTIEPRASPSWVRSAIKNAGYSQTDDKSHFYDDGNNRKNFMVPSHIYQAAI